MNARGHSVPARRLWWLAAGFTVWCNALVLLYALHAIGCVFAWPAGALRWTLVVVFVAHLVAVGWLWRKAASAERGAAAGDTGNFLQVVIEWTMIAAFAATLVTFGPPLWLTACL